MTPLSFVLIFSLISGQLIKIPSGIQGGLTLLDLTIILLDIFALVQLKFRLKKPPFWIQAAFLFLLIGFLSLLFTPLKLQLSEYFLSSAYTIRIAAFLVLGWVMQSGGLKTIKRYIPHILLFSGLGIATLGLLQFLFLPDLGFLASKGWDPHYFRTTSTFLDPNFVGAYFVLSLILLTQLKFKFQPIIFALVYLSLLTTFSRSSYLMFFVSFISLSFFKKSIKMAVLTIVLSLLLLLSFQIYIVLVNRSIQLDRNETARLRLSAWQQGLEVFQKNPILGAGFNAYNFALQQYNLGDKHFLSGKGATSNDSSLLYILSTTGILGLFAYLLFLLSLIKTAPQKNPIILVAILGLLAHSLFVNSLFYPFIFIWIILVSSYPYGSQYTK